jgi:hypothetical protein
MTHTTETNTATSDDIASAIEHAADQTNRTPNWVRIGMGYDAEVTDDESAWFWWCQITYTRARSRKGYQSSVEGFGRTPHEAADDAIAGIARAEAAGNAEAR